MKVNNRSKLETPQNITDLRILRAAIQMQLFLFVKKIDFDYLISIIELKNSPQKLSTVDKSLKSFTVANLTLTLKLCTPF
jgi:hypothetical protein